MTTTYTSKERTVRTMFDRIAPRYNLLNRLMTFGQDMSWRKQAIRMLAVPPDGRVLDIGTGTGDIALMMKKSHPSARIVGADMTHGMIRIAQARSAGAGIDWVIADAQNLPFAPGAYDRVISGFLLRNVADLVLALREQARVLAVGGRIIAMETTPPRKGWLRPLAVFHLRKVIPSMGRLIARDGPAYRYLPRSIEDFVTSERMSELVGKAGFGGVYFKNRMMGTVTIVTGERQPQSHPEKTIQPKKRKLSKYK